MEIYIDDETKLTLHVSFISKHILHVVYESIEYEFFSFILEKNMITFVNLRGAIIRCENKRKNIDLIVSRLNECLNSFRNIVIVQTWIILERRKTN
jgi:hypothetical protein